MFGLCNESKRHVVLLQCVKGEYNDTRTQVYITPHSHLSSTGHNFVSHVSMYTLYDVIAIAERAVPP